MDIAGEISTASARSSKLPSKSVGSSLALKESRPFPTPSAATLKLFAASYMMDAKPAGSAGSASATFCSPVPPSAGYVMSFASAPAPTVISRRMSCGSAATTIFDAIASASNEAMLPSIVTYSSSSSGLNGASAELSSQPQFVKVAPLAPKPATRPYLPAVNADAQFSNAFDQLVPQTPPI
ncbi:hypothetical protein SDC9_159284 [bioreactor metagenome]|uniref:Uncharacterized protein n=1 Tax=bioreactor metagenome TaxID=1076179 RepID=A0A645FC73_9ZZZZ